MPAPVNRFKAALAEGRTLTGLWLALANAYTAEICAGAGYDWLLVDGEHAPNHIESFVAQLQVLKNGSSAAIVRPPVGETWMIKQVLDIGAQTLLIPMVESGAQAQALAKAVRYPPHGVRGIGAALARASDFSRVTDYLVTADTEICLLLQVESRAGVAAIDDICAVDGVDGVFVGPADLAADLGFLGRPGAPEVVAAVEGAIARIRANGKPAGVLTSDPALAQRYHKAGATFIAIGSDVGLLAGAAARQLKDFPFTGA